MNTDVLTDTTCYHCGEDCNAGTVYLDDKSFCYSGCSMVYEILDQPVEIELVDHQVWIRFPSSLNKRSLKGTIELYYQQSGPGPKMSITLDEKGIKHLEMDKNPPGKWLVKITW